jgi:hypothetical protein
MDWVGLDFNEEHDDFASLAQPFCSFDLLLPFYGREQCLSRAILVFRILWTETGLLALWVTRKLAFSRRWLLACCAAKPYM